MSNKPYKQRQQEFFNLVEKAKNAGIPHPEVIAAQWALESDWGTKKTGKNNLFGIKAGNGDPNNKSPGTVVMTTEKINGRTVSMLQKFRDYDTLEEALADRAKFTSKKGGRYDKAGYFTASTPAEAAMALQRAGYATGDNYAKSLIDVMKGIGVDPFDGQKYDYSTTTPNTNTAQTTLPQYDFSAFNIPNTFHQSTTQPQQTAQEPQTTQPQNSFSSFMNDLQTMTPQTTALEPTTPKLNYQKQYQNQLAQAFGVTPKAELPDYISELVRSIYDQA